MTNNIEIYLPNRPPKNFKEKNQIFTKKLVLLQDQYFRARHKPQALPSIGLVDWDQTKFFRLVIIQTNAFDVE